MPSCRDWDSNFSHGQIDDVLISASLVDVADSNQLDYLEKKVDRLMDLCVLKNQPYFSVYDPATGMLSQTEALGSWAGKQNQDFIDEPVGYQGAYYF